MGERVTVEVDSAILAEARAANLDLSETLSTALKRHLALRLTREEKAAAAQKWHDDNKDAFSSINDFLDTHGLLANRLRYRPEKE